MDLLQTWVLIGVPGLAIVAGLFVGRSRRRAQIGYVVLGALIVAFFLTPSGGVSAAVLGAITVALVATGRGTRSDTEYQEHHETRAKFTHADS